MPNHISNRITVQSPTGDEAAATSAFAHLKALMKTDESLFDFNVLIPYPEHFEALDKARKEAAKTGASWRDLPKDGYNSGGYEWCCANWGTKWNAYDIVSDYDVIFCCTAWSTPHPIWAALSKRIPDIQLVIEYADEDRGNNCGILIYQAGKLVSSKTDKDGLPDPDLFARAVVFEQRCEYYYQKWHKATEKIEVLKQRIAELERAAVAGERRPDNPA